MLSRYTVTIDNLPSSLLRYTNGPIIVKSVNSHLDLLDRPSSSVKFTYGETFLSLGYNNLPFVFEILCA